MSHVHARIIVAVLACATFATLFDRPWAFLVGSLIATVGAVIGVAELLRNDS